MINRLKNTPYFFEFWLLLLISVGYVVALGLSTPLRISNVKWLTVPYRLLIFITSLYVLHKNFNWKRLLNIACISFVVFWIYYFFKLQYSFRTDFYLASFKSTQVEKLVRIFVIILIPGLALLLIDYTKVNLKKLGKVIFWVLFTMLSFNLLYGIVMFEGQSNLPHIFHMYYIWAGHLGTSLAIVSIFYLLFTQESKKYIYVLGLLLGLASIIVLRARSPFLALALVGLYYIIVRKEIKLLLLFIGFILLAIAAIYWFGSQNPESIQFAGRMYRWIFEGDTSLREPLFERGMEIFKANPLFGGRVYYEDGFYPHNIFIELLMATGMIGLITYILQYIPLFKTYKLYLQPKGNVYPILFFSIFLQYLILKMTSGDMINSYFIHFSCIIIGISSSYLRSDRV